jgi:hypothetical protein
MTDDELAAFYRRYNACCNEHRFDDLGQFVAPDVVINGTERGLDAYADALARSGAPSSMCTSCSRSARTRPTRRRDRAAVAAKRPP